MAGVSVGVGAGGVSLLTVGQAFGQGAAVFAIVCGMLASYIVITIPKRLFDSARVSQAREAPFLSAMVNTAISVTGSRSRTYLVVRSGDSAVERALSRIRKGIVLGMDSSRLAKSVAGGLASYSASNALMGAGSPLQGELADSGEESQGLSRAEDLTEETRYPFFLTVCFFSPLMMLLFAILSHSLGPVALAEVVGVELFILDITYYLCYGGRGAG